MIFINQFPKITDEQFKESIYRAMKNRAGDITKKLGFAYILVVAMMWFFTKDVVGTVYVFALAVLICLLLAIIGPRLAYRKMLKNRSVLATPSDLVNKVVIDSQMSIYRNETLMFTSEIEEIKVSLETENFFVLIMKGETIVQLEKNSFLEGSEETFREWLLQQGIRNKR